MDGASAERQLTDLTTLPVEEKSSGVELKLSPDKEQELGNYLRAVYMEIQGDRMPLEREWADNVQRYEAEFPKANGPWPGSSDIRPPLSRVISDTLQALYLDSLFGKTAKLKANPLRADDASKAHKNEVYMNYQLDEEIDFYGIADRFTADFLGPTGNAFLDPRYVLETEEREEEVTVTEPSNPDDPTSQPVTSRRTETTEDTIFDGVKVDLISSEFIFAAPIWDNAKEAAEKDVLIKVMPQSIEQIRRKMQGMTPKYHNQDAFTYLSGKKQPTLVQQARQRVDKISSDYLRKRVMINTAEAYLWWNIGDSSDPNKPKMERLIVTLDIDSGIVFRVIKGRCRIVHLKPFPIRGRFWGRSPLTIAKPLQKHLDAIINQRVDAGSIANMPCMFYRAGGTWNPQTFQLAPANAYPLENPGDVAWAPTPKVDQAYFLEESKVWEYVERLFGLSENVQSIENRGSTTATEAMEVAKRSAVKFGTPFRRIVNQLKPLFYHIHELNREFTPQEKQFRVTGNDGIPVFQKFTSNEASARLNFEFEVETLYDENMMRDTWMTAFKMFGSLPQIAMSPAHFYRLTQKAMQTVIGDTTAYLPVPEEAKLPSAEEAIELILRGERIDPMPGIDPIHYLRVFADYIDSQDFLQLTDKQQHDIFDFFAKTKLMKETLDKFGLNHAGMFPSGQPPEGGGGIPPVSVGQQPSKKFNNLRVGESPKSMGHNARNGGSNGAPGLVPRPANAGAGGPQPFSVR